MNRKISTLGAMTGQEPTIAQSFVVRRRRFSARVVAALSIAGLAVAMVTTIVAKKVNAADDAKKLVAALDTEYQAAVKKNDAATMDRLLADDFILVIGSGKVFTKADLLQEARTKQANYEHQEDTEQTVRVWGDTAVVTAKLWASGTQDGKPFDYALWFSDTYVRTPTGWHYVFGQASRPLPKPSEK
jgi:ketosteroid isomerase-like protein